VNWSNTAATAGPTSVATESSKPRTAVGLPSGDKVEADESEDAEYRGRRERVDQHDRRCGESDDPERHADVTGDLAESRVLAHGDTEGLSPAEEPELGSPDIA
jgi:hypothetical protein